MALQYKQMAPVTPTGVPATLIAGDTLLFDVSYSSYPVSEGWTLSFSFVGAGTLQTDAAWLTSSGNTWTVTVPATTTRTLNSKPGVYRWFAYMTGSGSYAGRRDTVDEGRIEILANPVQALDGDFQYQEEKDLAVVEAKIAGRLSDDLKAYTIKGRQVVLMEPGELFAERSRLKRAVWRLRNPGKAMPVLQFVYNGP